MTLYHFLNCVALTYLPCFIVYRSTKLSEFRAGEICMYAALGYVATQVAKMLTAATFLSSTDLNEFSLPQEALKAIIGSGDLLGIYLLLNYVRGDGTIKWLAVGLAWASADSVLKRLAPLWIGARSLEFDWKYVSMSIEANFGLILHISLASLIWIWSRKGAEGRLDSSKIRMIEFTLAVHSTIIPILSSYTRMVLFPADAWIPLACTALFSIIQSAVAYHIHQLYHYSIDKSQ